jgi:hypothetical protein
VFAGPRGGKIAPKYRNPENPGDMGRPRTEAAVARWFIPEMAVAKFRVFDLVAKLQQRFFSALQLRHYPRQSNVGSRCHLQRLRRRPRPTRLRRPDRLGVKRVEQGAAFQISGLGVGTRLPTYTATCIQQSRGESQATESCIRQQPLRERSRGAIARRSRCCSPLRLNRLRLRGPSGAQFEFTLAAIAQNLRRLAKLVARPPPVAYAACFS